VGSLGIVVETVFSNTFCFSPVLALLGFQGLVAFAVNVIPGEPDCEKFSFRDVDV
jgi:hypothetical protein